MRGYLRAGYPFLAVESHEEERVLEALAALGRELGRPVRPISVTAARRKDVEHDARTCLDAVSAHPDAAIFVLLDFHPFLGDPIVVRLVRDLRGRLEGRSQSLIFLSPHVELPVELETDFVVLEWPLPDAATLRALLEAEARAARVPLDAELAAASVRAVQGLTFASSRRAFRRALGEPDGLPSGNTEGLVAEKRRILKRTDLLELIDTPPALDAVGGLGALKAWLLEREAGFGEQARAFGLPSPKGLLLVGVQGCGKSLSAKAVARAWGLPLARLDFSALFTYGRSPEQSLRRVLRLAETLSPIVLWLDEIDKVFKSVGEDESGSEELQRLFAAFITWLQEKTAPAFVVATANAVDRLPPELLRKGRFDEIFFVDLPSLAERSDILGIHLRAHRRDPARYDLAELASSCEHMSGAELEQIVIGGLFRAFRDGRDLTMDDLRIVAKATVPLYRTYEDQIKALREWAKTRARRASTDHGLAELWAGQR
ncbi:MAG: AAA family ATPase [Deltaproteobacteria bacterium]|nr:AAA family ATPase [Deltaproteobacteria bacterium]